VHSLKPYPHRTFFPPSLFNPVRQKDRWLPLVIQPRNRLFNPYSSSYKHFKDTFIKISFESEGREYIYHRNEPKFPLYWTRSLVWCASWPWSELSAEDISALSILHSFPRGIPAREILNNFWCEDPNNTVLGTFFFCIQLFIYMAFIDLLQFVQIMFPP